MKKLLLLLIVCSVFNICNAQYRNFLPAKSIDQLKMAEASLTNVNPQYHFRDTRTVVLYDVAGKKQTFYTDVLTDSLHNNINFEYQNQDGVFCHQVSGPFEDVFVFWKKYFDPNSDIKRINTVGGIVRGATFKKSPETNDWVIDVR